jgi:hypothetical protein
MLTLLINTSITVQCVVNLGIIVGFAQISPLSTDEPREHGIGLLKVSIHPIILVIVLITVQIVKPVDLMRTMLLTSLIVIDCLISTRLGASIVHLARLLIATLIASPKSLIPLGYFRPLKTGQRIT